MITSACIVMRNTAISAISLVGAGSLLVLLAQLMTLQTALPVFISYLGLFSIFIGMVTMVATMLAILLPAVSRRLDLCEY